MNADSALISDRHVTLFISSSNEMTMFRAKRINANLKYYLGLAAMMIAV